MDRQELNRKKIDWWRHLPFWGVHAMCLGIIFVGWSWVAVATAALLYVLHVFSLTGFYHRYFSHRTFKTSRVCQFVFGWMGCSALQRGPLWWAAHHRHHHLYSDDENDVHSPKRQGFFWSHMGWFLHPTNFQTNLRLIPDLAKFPELRFLDKFDVLPPFALAAFMFGLGWLLSAVAPGLETSGTQMLIWGFFIPVVVVYHVTYSINSLAHLIGRRTYPTNDDSRNNWFLAILSFGEGWHNNHHYYPASVRQGFRWWQVDFTYYALVVLSWLGLIWNLNPPPARAYKAPPPDIAGPLLAVGEPADAVAS